MGIPLQVNASLQTSFLNNHKTKINDPSRLFNFISPRRLLNPKKNIYEAIYPKGFHLITWKSCLHFLTPSILFIGKIAAVSGRMNRNRLHFRRFFLRPHLYARIIGSNSILIESAMICAVEKPFLYSKQWTLK